MKEVLIDRTQFLDIGHSKLWNMLKPKNKEFKDLKYEEYVNEAWYKRYSYNTEKLEEHIRGKTQYPDCACGRGCLRLEDAVEAFMKMDDLSVLEIARLWEDFGTVMASAIGIPNDYGMKYSELPKKYEKKHEHKSS